MDWHLHIYVNCWLRTSLRALSDPWIIIFWSRRSVDWSILAKDLFAAAAPVLWNDLPLHIKQSPSVDIFKSRIKTRLFQLANFIWLCKCMYVYFMLSIMNRLGLNRSYVTCTFASALVSKGQISIWHICLILKLALYKYHIIIIIIMHICHWTVINEMIKGGYYSWIRDSMETRSTLLWSAPE